jgi:hypothetical protein
MAATTPSTAAPVPTGWKVAQETMSFACSALSDAGDTITDFNATGDLFELSALMTAIVYIGSDAVADGYVGLTSRAQTCCYR